MIDVEAIPEPYKIELGSAVCFVLVRPAAEHNRPHGW